MLYLLLLILINLKIKSILPTAILIPTLCLSNFFTNQSKKVLLSKEKILLFLLEVFISSILGNYVDLLTITNFKNKNSAQKRVIFITSRVHPGETPSSFVCEGIIKYLIG